VPKPADQAVYGAKLTELADVITAAAPDLLAVQEVGDAASFEALRPRLDGTVRDAFRDTAHDPGGLALPGSAV
jgi:hypothetical protein